MPASSHSRSKASTPSATSQSSKRKGSRRGARPGRKLAPEPRRPRDERNASPRHGRSSIRRRSPTSQRQSSSSGSKSRSPDGEGVDDGEDDQSSAESGGEDPTSLQVKERMVGRTCFMFENIGVIIDAGLPHLDELKTMDTTQLTPEFLEQLTLFAILLELIPILPDILRECSGKDVQGIVRQLSNGRNKARGSDICGLKKVAPHFGNSGLIEFDPDKLRHLCGFESEITGRLLCPADHDYDDKKIREGLRSGTIKVWAQYLPYFVFENATPNHDDPLKGLFMSMWILRAMIAIFISPSASKGDGDIRNRSKKNGNAAAHGIKWVNICMIAYATTLLRFVLSDQDEFSAGSGPGTWPYRCFYRHIKRTLLNLPDDDRDEILQWYRQNLFGDPDSSSSESDGDDNGDSFDKLLAKCITVKKKEAEAKKVADGKRKEAVDGKRKEVVEGKRKEVVDGKRKEAVDGKRKEAVDGKRKEAKKATEVNMGAGGRRTVAAKNVASGSDLMMDDDPRTSPGTEEEQVMVESEDES